MSVKFILLQYNLTMVQIYYKYMTFPKNSKYFSSFPQNIHIYRYKFFSMEILVYIWIGLLIIILCLKCVIRCMEFPGGKEIEKSTPIEASTKSSGDIHFKVCAKCGEEQSSDNFRYQSNICQSCVKDRAYRKRIGTGRGLDLWDTVYQQPGSYRKGSERQEVKEILEACGWKYNPQLKLWWKSGIKNQFGVWNFQREKHSEEELNKLIEIRKAMTEKVCYHCSEKKSIDNFIWNGSKNNWYSWCKICKSEKLQMKRATGEWKQ